MLRLKIFTGFIKKFLNFILLIMKNYLKKVTVLFVFALGTLFSGCTKEVVESKKNEAVLTYKSVSLSDLSKSNSDKKLIETVNNIKKLKPNAFSKAIYNPLYDFYIDQDNGKLVETADSKNYTFPIYRMSGDNDIENIVFTQNADESYDVMTTKYEVTKEELEANPIQTLIPVDFSILSSKVLRISNKPIVMDVVMCDNDGAGGYGAEHSAGGNCTDPNHLYTVTVVFILLVVLVQLAMATYQMRVERVDLDP
jgi:hypothetical protein